MSDHVPDEKNQYGMARTERLASGHAEHVANGAIMGPLWLVRALLTAGELELSAGLALLELLREV